MRQLVPFMPCVTRWLNPFKPILKHLLPFLQGRYNFPVRRLSRIHRIYQR
jgi:hypothetical protein